MVEGEEHFRFVEYYDETTESPNCTFFDPEICQFNVTQRGNGTLTGLNILFMSITTLVLGLIILVTIIGNVFVIAAVMVEKNLQSVANRLIVSLAFADCLVACIVMPLSAVNEVAGQWVLGNVVCYIWTSSDVLLCTASILHLLAIAVDRFWAVTDIEYIRNRNKARINTMILLIWLVGGAVSLPPLLGWKDEDFDQRILEKKCLVSQDVFYQIFATMATFYVPLGAILILYWKIWKEARMRIRHRPGKTTKPPDPAVGPITKTNSAMSLSPCQQPVGSNRESTTEINPSPELLTPAGDNNHHHHHQNDQLASPSTVEIMLDDCSGGNISTSNTLSPISGPNIAIISSPSMMMSISPSRHNNQNHQKPKKTQKETIESKREKKAAQTLAIITGAFIFCWLPFFVSALILSLCAEHCNLPEYVMSIFLWLGYFNSTLNPLLYTIFRYEKKRMKERDQIQTH